MRNSASFMSCETLFFIQAIGGSCFRLKAGVPTGLNPFQLPDTAEKCCQGKGPYGDRSRGVLVAITSDVFSAIVQQTPTKIFLPNLDAKYEDGY